jgi:hypothetical protein
VDDRLWHQESGQKMSAFAPLVGAKRTSTSDC